MRQKINWRYLIKVSALVVVSIAAIHFTHRWQVRQQVSVFLQHADEAKDAKNFEREITYLRRYLMVRPNDLETRDRLAQRMYTSARTGRQLTEAFLFAENVLRRDPNRDELRRLTINYAMHPQIGLYTDAQEHVRKLLETHPDDGELQGMFARCLEMQGKFRKEGDQEGAVDWYVKSIKNQTGLIASYESLAAIFLLHLNKPEEAHQTIASMLTTNPNNFRAHLAVARYWQKLSEMSKQSAFAFAQPVAIAQALSMEMSIIDAIDMAIGTAHKLAPNDLEVILLSADAIRSKSRSLARVGKKEESQKAIAEARQILNLGTELHPKSSSIYLALASLQAETQSAADAVSLIRKGLETLPDAADLTTMLLDYQIQAGDILGATETLEKLRAADADPLLADYQQCRIFMLQEKWLEATLLLESTQSAAVKSAALARETDLLLGRCYSELGQRDRSLEAYARGVPELKTDPLWVPALVGLGETQAALGMADAALTTYRRLKDQAPGAWLQIARFEMIRVLRTPSHKRDWKPVQDALSEADRVFKDVPKDLIPTDYYLLHCDMLIFRDPPNPAEARKRLDALSAKRPKDLAIWTALAQQEIRAGNPKGAADKLDEAARLLGDSSALRLARARLFSQEKGSDVPARIAALANDLEKLPPAQQGRLLRDLAELTSAIGSPGTAEPLWKRLAQLRPDDVGVQLILFDRALHAGDDATAERILGQVRRIDGENGAFSRLGRALLLIRAAQTNKRLDLLSEALSLLDSVANDRPRWARVALAQAIVFDLRNDTESAIGKYRSAIASGEASPEALRRLIELLHSKGRDLEAQGLLAKLYDSSTSSPEVQRLAAEVYLSTDDNSGRALNAAIKAVPEDSKVAKDQIWRGQFYWAAGDRTKAEIAFRKAVELEPTAPGNWLILIRYLTLTARKNSAEEALKEAKGKVIASELPLFEALAYVHLDQTANAINAFSKAKQAFPDDLRIAQAEAEFLFDTGNLLEARKAFERLIGLHAVTEEQREIARRMIAITLAADRDYQTSRKALEAIGLVDSPKLAPAERTESPAQRRTRILVLALQRDRASKLEATRLLEEDLATLSPSDQYFLAGLYFTVGNRGRARSVLADLVRKPEAARVPLYLVTYTDWLLREGDIKEAEEWVKRLEKLQPNSMQTAVLKAKIFAAKKDSASALKVLSAQAELKDAPLTAIAQTCEEIGLFDEAESLLKRFTNLNKKENPQSGLVLAAFYGRRARTADAIRTCEALLVTVSPLQIGDVAVTALYSSPQPVPTESAKVAAWLEAAAEKSDGQRRAILYQQLASVRNLQGDYSASAALYRKAIAVNPKDVLAMNNLAYLLSFVENKHDEALLLVDTAKKIFGPNTDLLDTEAIIRLKNGNLDSARTSLQESLLQQPSATAYFHLAQLELASERTLEAKAAWGQAVELKLSRSGLHPLEWVEYDRIAKIMK